MFSIIIIFLIPFSVFGQFEPNSNGGPIVHLFQWKWVDIANECENFLSKHKFGGVQISPPNEYVIIDTPEIQRPWYEVYQPVSYKLETRFGNEQQFSDMVKRCNNVGVRIYVDAVINHMSGKGNPGATATGGSKFDGATQSYPDYQSKHFNDDKCTSEDGDIHDYQNSDEVRDCKLYGLNDLDLSNDYVREKIVNYLNKLIDLGVAGFRIDAAKHMHPQDLQVILNDLQFLNTDYFDPESKPFIYNEVIDLGNDAVRASEYFDLGYVTEFKYCNFIGEVFKKINGKQLVDLKNISDQEGYITDDRAFIFVGNHDNQRGHGAGGESILTYKDQKLHAMAVAFTLSYPYGIKRIMSSYSFEDTEMGPPQDSNQNIISPTFTNRGECRRGWMCEHRIRPMYNLAEFSAITKGTNVLHWWDNGANQIAFSRGNVGFVAFNNEEKGFSETLQTGLPEGKYCDVVTGDLLDGECTGTTVIVQADGTSDIVIVPDDKFSLIAIHTQAML